MRRILYFLLMCASLSAQDTVFDQGYWYHGMDERLHVGGLIQVDFWGFPKTDEGDSTFLIRRARLYATGAFDGLYSYMLMARFDKFRDGDLEYAWIETLKPTFARFRVGLMKEPFSLNALYSSAYLDFNERSLFVINYLQIFDVGAMLFGRLFDDQLEYAIGIYNGRGADKFDNNQSKEGVARLVYRPLEKVYFGVSGSCGKQTEDLEGMHFVTGVDTKFWTWKDDVEVNSARNRIGADFEWYYGPGVVRTEALYVDWGKIHKHHQTKRFTGWGWYGEGTYILTGEEKPRDQDLVPLHPMDFTGCNWGAFEIGARYELFWADQALIDARFAKGASHVHSYTLALNWYLIRQICCKFDWQQFYFNHHFKQKSHCIDRVSVAILRFQAEF